MDNQTFDADDPVQLYLSEVNKIPPLSRDEEIRCVQHLRAGDEQAEAAKARLTEAHLLLVVSIVERYRTSGPVHFLDLIIKGNEGLMLAVQTLGDTSRSRLLSESGRGGR